MNMSHKQETFCQHYLLTGSASDAYRYAYNTVNMKPESVHRKAHELMNNVKIRSRIHELQDSIKEKYEITMDGQISKYMNLLSTAEHQITDPKHKVDAMVKIMSRLDKISGLEHRSNQEKHGDIVIVIDEKDIGL